MNILKERWMAVDGSVVVERPTTARFDRNPETRQVHQAVAFNVGDDVARHIVQLHNSFLRPPL